MGILWIASYPKSGNTWVRAFLANYATGSDTALAINDLSNFGHSDGNIGPYEQLSGKPFATLSDIEIAHLRPRAQALMGAGQAITPVKTHAAIGAVHGAPTINMAVTAGAIYILRNPLDIVLSYADHYGLSHEQAVDALTTISTAIARSSRTAPEHLGDWGAHVRSWTSTPSPMLRVVRYEDLQQNPAEAFSPLPAMLGLPQDPARTAQAIRHASFDELSRQEAQDGFRERSANQQRFFRKGGSGQWRQDLAPALIDRMVTKLKPEMQRFGYLDANGAPV